MAGKSYENIVKDYRRARKNYLGRYRYWSDKLGSSYMPAKIEFKNTKKERIYVRDIAELEKAKEGYFKAQHEQNRREYEYNEKKFEEDIIELRSLRDKFIREVDKYYTEFISFPDKFENQNAQKIVQDAISHISSIYTKEQIAYILRENWDKIQNIITKAKLYDNNKGGEKILDLMFTFVQIFDDAVLPYYIDEETWDDNDRDFNNSGAFGEYGEEDMR